MNLLEIDRIENLKEDLKDFARFECLAHAKDQQTSLPIYKISFGSTDPQAPVLGLIGGVHGLERIGAQVCLSLLHSLSQLLFWDKNMRRTLESMRIFFIPTVNPIGILRKKRANPNGVDIMRNAPIEAVSPVPWLLGGHRISSKLPWYRGELGAELELETKTLIQAVDKEISQSPTAITVDFHSGYGLQDQLWFPYAKTNSPWPDLAKMHAFKKLLDKTYPHHFYKVEPPAYLTHGDLWDYLYDEHIKVNQQSTYMPLTLEMGSWSWVRKNPLQFFSAEGPFNPMISHRISRTLRRHNTFFEFLIRAVSSSDSWSVLSEEQKLKHELQARELWYDRKK